MFHDKKPEVDFSIKGLSILNVSFRQLHIDIQTQFFNIIAKLKESLTQALASCLHYSLIKTVIEKKWFWPDIAIAIGITPPTPKPSMKFGQTGLYYLGHSMLRATAAREIDNKAREHELDFEQILLETSLSDCTKWKGKFKAEFAKRFDTTIDNATWFEAATAPTIAEFKAERKTTNYINQWPISLGHTLKKMLDSLSNFLIFFSLPEAQYRNRELLRIFFQK